MKDSSFIESLSSSKFFCLDTETTGFSPENGDKIIEVGIVEIDCLNMTRRFFHKYVNPGRPIPKSSSDIHGITDDFVKDKEKFSSIAEELRAFIGDEIVVAHNASFDKKFLDFEFTLCNKAVLKKEQVFDSLKLAREKFPGAQCSLDALCRKFGIDMSSRKFHGALVDARLLAKVFVKLVNLSLQKTIDCCFQSSNSYNNKKESKISACFNFGQYDEYALTEEEKCSHNAIVEKIGNLDWKL